MTILTLGQPPADSPLHVEGDQVDVSSNIHWTSWLSLIFNILLNVGPTMRKVVDVTFPPCPPMSSIDVTIPFLGVKPAMFSGEVAPTVVLGLSANTQFTTNNCFQAFVSAVDEVTIRQLCIDPFGIGGFTDTFTITVLTGEAGRF